METDLIETGFFGRFERKERIKNPVPYYPKAGREEAEEPEGT